MKTARENGNVSFHRRVLKKFPDWRNSKAPIRKLKGILRLQKRYVVGHGGLLYPPDSALHDFSKCWRYNRGWHTSWCNRLVFLLQFYTIQEGQRTLFLPLCLIGPSLYTYRSGFCEQTYWWWCSWKGKYFLFQPFDVLADWIFVLGVCARGNTLSYQVKSLEYAGGFSSLNSCN